MRRRFTVIVFPLCLLIIDRGLKFLAEQSFQLDVGWFRFMSFHNTGIIFSWPLPNSVALALMILATIGVGWLAVKHWRHGGRQLFCALLILLGAVSNLYDRAVHQYIIDFAYFGRWFPIFNIADVMIGAGLVGFLVWRKHANNTLTR